MPTLSSLREEIFSLCSDQVGKNKSK
uniref:Uncharacterized protein n=1 Tax=Anguilla anguilla TaxID=7936 RepID=A0A0E9T314_ANGAN